MVNQVIAWKDDRGNVFTSKSNAVMSNMKNEISNSFGRMRAESLAATDIFEYISENPEIIKNYMNEIIE